MDIKPLSYLKNNASDLLAQINETQRPVVITQNGEPRAVVQDPASYQHMRDAISLLKLIAQGEQDIQAGRTVPARSAFARARATRLPRKA
jgi:prevent-host-death family protein